MPNKNLIVLPQHYPHKNELKKAVTMPQCDYLEYDTVISAVQKVEGVHTQYRRVVFLDDFGIFPFMYFSKLYDVVAASVYDEHSAYMTPFHNNCKIMCMGYEISTFLIISSSINIFFRTEYEGARHVSRIDMLKKELE